MKYYRACSVIVIPSHLSYQRGDANKHPGGVNGREEAVQAEILAEGAVSAPHLGPITIS